MPSQKIKLSDYIADFLAEKGIRHVFVVSGGAAVHMIDSIAKHPKIQYICAQHEQGAGTAADGYARITNNLGAVMVTSGPGPTNLVTSVANAFYDSIPVIFLCGQVATFRIKQSPDLRQKGFQETEIGSIFQSLTNYVGLLRDPNDIRYELEKAVYWATTGRKGPVVLDIPDDLQRVEIEMEKLMSYIPPEPQANPLLNESFRAVADLISQAKRPIIIYGAGIRLAGVEKQALEFARYFRIPMVLTWGGVDLIPYDDELNMNTIGACGPRWGNFAVQNSDLVIAMGTRLSQLITGGKPNLFAPKAKKIMIDIDREELNKFTPNIFNLDLKIETHLGRFFATFRHCQSLNRKKLPDKFKSWRDQIKTWKAKYPICPPTYCQQENPVNPYVFIKELSRQAKEGDIFYADTGANLAWTCQAFEIKAGQRIISAWSHTPMGFSLPASIGAALGLDKEIICLIGDGGLMMCLSELATVRSYSLPIKIFIFNNHGHGIQKQTIDTWLEGRHQALDEKTGLWFPNFIKIGKTFGLQTVKIWHHTHLKERVREVLATKGPVLCDVEIIPDQKIVPMLKFGAGLEDLGPDRLPPEEMAEIMKVSED